AKNKCLAQMNKSGTAGKTTKKARNPASRVDPMGADHRVVPAIKQALSMLPQPWSQRAMLTSNDYKELAARCTELASESSEPTGAEAVGALASYYPARAAGGGCRAAAPAALAGNDAEAVVLDLVQPRVAGGQLVGLCGKARRD